jgi:signal transduction histidine kinase
LSVVFHERAGFWLAPPAMGVAAVLVQPLRATLQRRVDRLTHGPSRDLHAPARGIRARLREVFAPETAELQRARERLVATREEARRRLRRDLHDGLGPALAGAALKVEAAENLIESDPSAAARLLGDAGIQIRPTLEGRCPSCPRSRRSAGGWRRSSRASS